MSDPILAASDALSTAADFVRALEMTTRDRMCVYADPNDMNAVSTVCFAALDQLAEARKLLALVMKGEIA